MEFRNDLYLFQRALPFGWRQGEEEEEEAVEREKLGITPVALLLFVM